MSHEPTRRRQPATLRRARALRRRLTPTEGKLWRRLRDRRARFKFRRQHPVGMYVLDFYCPEAKLAIEIDGQRHAEPEQVRRDRLRTRHLERTGIRAMRFPVSEVERSMEIALTAIWDAVVARVQSEGRRAEE